MVGICRDGTRVRRRVNEDELRSFCRANGIRRLGLFGSALRGELGPDSDIDLLVEFQSGRIRLLGLAQLELEPTGLVGRTARVLYDAA